MPGIVHDLENKKQTRSAATECKYACIALAHAWETHRKERNFANRIPEGERGVDAPHKFYLKQFGYK